MYQNRHMHVTPVGRQLSPDAGGHAAWEQNQRCRMAVVPRWLSLAVPLACCVSWTPPADAGEVACRPCSDPTCDSLAVQAILDYNEISVRSLSDVSHRSATGRIVVLDLSRTRRACRLPPQIGMLNELRELHMSGESVLYASKVPPMHGVDTGPTFPSEIALLSKLEVLDAPCLIRVGPLPSGLWTLPRLRKINLRWAGVDSLPQGIAQLARLECLDVSLNRIGRLPDGLVRMAALCTLRVSDNRLTALPAALRTSRVFIDVTRNQLCGVPVQTAEWLDTHAALGWRETQHCDGRAAE